MVGARHPRTCSEDLVPARSASTLYPRDQRVPCTRTCSEYLVPARSASTLSRQTRRGPSAVPLRKKDTFRVVTLSEIASLTLWARSPCSLQECKDRERAQPHSASLQRRRIRETATTPPGLRPPSPNAAHLERG